MLTKLLIQFPDRVPKEDHDKILKDQFFCGIKSKLQNSIRHLYNNESITLSQLLVKARQNEEEETTSKIVSKNVTIGHDSTLEHRVGNLIAIQPLLTPLTGIIIAIMVALLFSPIHDLSEIMDKTLGIPLWISGKI